MAYIADQLQCNPNSQLDNKSLDALTQYVKGIKVDFMIPNQPNTKRSFKVVGLLGTANNFQ